MRPAQRKYNASSKGRAKNNAYTTSWRMENPEKYRASLRKHDLKRHYGMTPEEHNSLFTSQGSCCGACGSPDPGRKSGDWSTDHDHETGVVRGILCNGCNLALGHTKDDPARLRKLAEYIETHHGRDVPIR